jgi:uncharacterized membrane protein
MKKLIFAAGLATSVVFSACTTAQQQTVTANMLQARVVQACAVVAPELRTLAALASGGNALLDSEASALAALANNSGVVCQATAGADITSVQSLINTSIPAALAIVNGLPLSTQERIAVQAGLIAFQAALSAPLATLRPEPMLSASAPDAASM